MITDPQSLFNTVIAVAGAACAWTMKLIYDRIKDLEARDERLSDNVEEIRQNYARRDDVKDFVGEIKATLLRIESKLDMKADK